MTTREAKLPTEEARWAEPKIGGRGQFRFFEWVLRHLGIVRAYHLSYFGTLWYVLFYPSIRKRCRPYLSRRFPQRRNVVGRWLDTYRLVRAFGITLVDMAATRVLGTDALEVNSPDRSRLRELAAGDKGFILLHYHVGCWQVGMSALGNLGKRVSLVMIPEPRTLAMFTGRDASVIDPRTGLAGVMQMTDALLRGEIVAMMGDRTFGDEHNCVAVQFLGGTIQLPITPYRLASASGVPIVLVTVPKISRRGYELRLNRVIEVPPGLGRVPAHYALYAQKFADELADFVRKYPWQFYNFYDLWESANPKPQCQIAELNPND
jgi:predicted LPLAT superfamily acyltransferase